MWSTFISCMLTGNDICHKICHFGVECYQLPQALHDLLSLDLEENKVSKARKTSSTLNMFSGEKDASQTKPKSDENTRNLARDS